MPANQRSRLNNRECVLPIETFGEQRKRQARCPVRPPGFQVTFLVQGKLPPEEQIFGRHGIAWP